MMGVGSEKVIAWWIVCLWASKCEFVCGWMSWNVWSGKLKYTKRRKGFNELEKQN